jgi:hypothetical protein
MRPMNLVLGLNAYLLLGTSKETMIYLYLLIRRSKSINCDTRVLTKNSKARALVLVSP